MKGWPLQGLFFWSKEQAALFLPPLEGQGKTWLILFFPARPSEGMIGLVAEIAKDCVAPGSFNYAKTDSVKCKKKKRKSEVLKFRLNTDSAQEKWILPADLKWICETFVWWLIEIKAKGHLITHSSLWWSLELLSTCNLVSICPYRIWLYRQYENIVFWILFILLCWCNALQLAEFEQKDNWSRGCTFHMRNLCGLFYV